MRCYSSIHFKGLGYSRLLKYEAWKKFWLVLWLKPSRFTKKEFWTINFNLFGSFAATKISNISFESTEQGTFSEWFVKRKSAILRYALSAQSTPIYIDTPRPYLTFIVDTDHSVLAGWQQYRPISAVWLSPNSPECRYNVRISSARLR